MSPAAPKTNPYLRVATASHRYPTRSTTLIEETDPYPAQSAPRRSARLAKLKVEGEAAKQSKGGRASTPHSDWENKRATKQGHRARQVKGKTQPKRPSPTPIADKKSKRPRKTPIVSSTHKVIKARQKGPQKSPPVRAVPQIQNSRSPIAGQPQQDEFASVVSWLHDLDPTAPPDSVAVVIENSEVMAPSLGVSRPQTEISTVPTSNPKTETNRTDYNKLVRGLKSRNADPNEPVKGDEWCGILSDWINSEKPGIDIQKVDELVGILREFIKRCETPSIRSNTQQLNETVDLYRQKINTWLPSYDQSTITQADFDKGIKACRNSNEAALQRLILPLAIDYLRLNEAFGFAFESLWSDQNEHLIKSTKQGDKIKRQKPDLAISFTKKAICDGARDNKPPPEDLTFCISPDDSDRCFPYLFFETKKGADSLDKTMAPHMNSASQALYNIFKCMERVGKVDEFYKDVRVFSISLNAEKIITRIYRALRPKQEGDAMEFTYEEFQPILISTKYTLSNLVQDIFLGYALDELLPTLQDTYRALVDKSRVENQAQFSPTRAGQEALPPTDAPQPHADGGENETGANEQRRGKARKRNRGEKEQRRSKRQAPHHASGVSGHLDSLLV